MPAWLVAILVGLLPLLFGLGGGIGGILLTRSTAAKNRADAAKTEIDAQDKLASGFSRLADRKDVEIERLTGRVALLEKDNATKAGEIDHLNQNLLVERQARNQQQIETNFLKGMYQSIYEQNQRLEAHIKMLERQIQAITGVKIEQPPQPLGMAAFPVFPMPTQAPATPGVSVTDDAVTDDAVTGVELAIGATVADTDDERSASKSDDRSHKPKRPAKTTETPQG